MAKNLVNGTNVVIEENGDNINMNLSSSYLSTLETRLLGIETNISNIKGTILWANEHPTQAMAQTDITLSSSDYDILEIFFVHKAGNNFSTYSIRMLKNSVGTRCFIPSIDGMVYRVITKNTDTSITVNSVTGSEDNSLAVPLYIIGYKTGLFN